MKNYASKPGSANLTLHTPPVFEKLEKNPFLIGS